MKTKKINLKPDLQDFYSFESQLISNENSKRAIILNKTPIDLLSKNGNAKNTDIYNKTSYELVDKSIIYKFYEDDVNPWKFIDKTKFKDFRKKYSFASNSKPLQITTNNFGNLKVNEEYSKVQPLLMYNPTFMSKGKKGLDVYKNIFVSKILVSKNDGIHSIYKKDLKTGFFNNDYEVKKAIQAINNDFFEPQLVYVIYNDNDEIIDVFRNNNNLKFDDKDVIKHNVNAILSDHLRKDKSVVFVKKTDGKWTDKPISNNKIMIYNLIWNNLAQVITFNSFENIHKFIEDWVSVNAKTTVVKG